MVFGAVSRCGGSFVFLRSCRRFYHLLVKFNHFHQLCGFCRPAYFCLERFPLVFVVFLLRLLSHCGMLAVLLGRLIVSFREFPFLCS